MSKLCTRRSLFILVLVLGTRIVYAQSNAGITFIENLGQYPAEVQYYAAIPGGALFVEETGLTYSFSDPDQLNNHASHLKQSKQPKFSNYYALKIKFLEANNKVISSGENPVPTRYSFFRGKDRSQWISGAKGYRQVVLSELYEGIDLQLSSSLHGLKYDLIVKPGTNPDCIKMQYAGATEMSLKEGQLSIDIPYTSLTEQIPASYAICDSASRKISSKYLLDGNTVSFSLEETDPAEALLIDPLLVFSTYSGSPSDNWGNTATYDEYGNGYAGGMTREERNGPLPPFPATPGAYQQESAGGWDTAILKFDSIGQNLLYATHLGGESFDVPQSLIVDQDGNLLILGITSSPNFPTTENAYDSSFNGGITTSILGIQLPNGSDLYVAKLSEDGTQLLSSTFIGGQLNDGILDSENELARNYGDESRGDINIDSKGNVIIASRSNSLDFPMVNAYDETYNGNIDAVVFSLSQDLKKMNFSTYIGGADSDVALSVKLDENDNIYLAGGTQSNDFPVTTGVYKESLSGLVDGWVAKLNSTGDSIISNTFIGTISYDQAFFIDLDGNNDVYVAGQTSGAYPVTSGKFSSGVTGQFIHKLSNDLTKSLFSTVINSSSSFQPSISLTAFLVNECNNIYLSGWGSPEITRSPEDNYFVLNTSGMPVTGDAYQITSDGSSFYLMVLTGDASELLYATHLGNKESYVHVDGGTSRFDKHGIVYHSVCASCGGNSTFPTTPGAYSEVNGSTGCNNALFKFDLASLSARIQTNSVLLDNPGLSGGCLPLTVVFENNSTAGEIFEWDFGDGASRTTYTKDSIIHIYEKAGNFNVRLRAFDPNTCIAEDFAYTSIRVSAPNFSISPESNICSGSAIQLLATGGDTYQWSPTAGLNNPNIAAPIASPSETTVYTVEVLNPNGCTYLDSVTVNVFPSIIPSVRLIQSELCNGSREIQLLNDSENANTVIWNLGDGTYVEEWELSHEYAADGDYSIKGLLKNEACEAIISFDLQLIALSIPNVLTRNNDSFNDYFKITSATPVDLSVYTRWGTKVYQADGYNNDWNGEGLSSGVYFYEVLLYNGEVCSGWLQLLDG